jgi:hypothetical protein
MLTASRILGTEVGSTAPVFLAFLAIHVLGGLTAVASGAIAAIARKGSPRHIRAGRWYYRPITVVFLTATILAAMRWRQDYYLFILGAAAAFRDRSTDHRPRRHPRPPGTRLVETTTGRLMSHRHMRPVITHASARSSPSPPLILFDASTIFDVSRKSGQSGEVKPWRRARSPWSAAALGPAASGAAVVQNASVRSNGDD